MYPRRIAQSILSNAAWPALWMVLSSCIVLANPWAISPTLTPPYQWAPTVEGGWFSSSPEAIATMSFSTSGENWNILTIPVHGYYGYGANKTLAPFIIKMDGFPTTYIYPTEPLVNISITSNHVYNVVISPAHGATGLFIQSATVSRSNVIVQTPSPGAVIVTTTITLPNSAITTSTITQLQNSSITTSTITQLQNSSIATSTTTQSQDPLMTTAAATTTNISTETNTTVVVVTNSVTSQASVAATSFETLDPFIYPPSTSVSLTNSNPPHSANDIPTSSSKQPKYGTIVGAVFGILALISICFFSGLIFYRRRQRKHIPPSMAYMNYRSTTEQTPRYHFHKDRTAFSLGLTNNRAGIGARGGGLLSAGKLGSILSPLDEKISEWLMNPHSRSPYTNDNTGSVSVLERYPSLDSTIDGSIARTLSPPSSTDATALRDPFATSMTGSERNSNAYEDVEDFYISDPFQDHRLQNAGQNESRFGSGRAI